MKFDRITTESELDGILTEPDLSLGCKIGIVDTYPVYGRTVLAILVEEAMTIHIQLNPRMLATRGRIIELEFTLRTGSNACDSTRY